MDGKGTPARIDTWMPVFEVATRHERAVAAPPAVTYAALRRVDLAASPVVRALLAARGLLRPGGRDQPRTIDGVVAAGFTLLEEQVGAEIVLGLTGRFWRPCGDLLRLTPEEFIAFVEPGWTQAAWSFRVSPAIHGTLLSTETRVRATDDRARRAFRRYWLVVAPLSGLIRRRVLALVAAEAERSAT